MEKRTDTVLDTQGRPISGATVRVNTYPAGALATIYSDNGVTTKSNPMVTDSAGYFEYYADNGHYSLIVTTDTSVKTINDVMHFDPLSGLGDVYDYVAIGGETVIMLPFVYTYNTKAIEVHADGIALDITKDYTEHVNGDRITMTSALTAGLQVKISGVNVT